MAVFKDKLFEAQWLRAAGHSSYGAAEIAECLEVARQIGGADPERWFEAWSGFASRLFEAAERSEHAGRAASARGAYLRASNYWRAAWTFLFQAPIDARALHAYRRHREAFIRAAKLMTPAGEAIRIPYEGKLLHGYFFKAGDDGAPRKTLIINGGYDSTAERRSCSAARRRWSEPSTRLCSMAPAREQRSSRTGSCSAPTGRM